MPKNAKKLSFGPSSRVEFKQWREQEKKKLEAIDKAFNTEVAVEEAKHLRQKLNV